MQGLHEGARGAWSRQQYYTAHDEDDVEECEFWNTACTDVDCIYEGEHFRYQCAMAELVEEPRSMVLAAKQGLRLGRSAMHAVSNGLSQKSRSCREDREMSA